MVRSRLTEIGARPVRVIGAGKGATSGEHEPMIVVAFGDSFADAEFVALGLVDAERLGRRLIAAVGEPAPLVA